MKIELKNVKYAAFASEETNCFSLTIYVDGVRSGTARNDGKGGMTFIEPHSLRERFEAFAATLPPLDVSRLGTPGETMPMDAELLIDGLFEDHLTKRDLKRLCSTKVLFRVPGETYVKGEYCTVKAKFSDALKAQLVAKYGPGVEIINETI